MSMNEPGPVESAGGISEATETSRGSRVWPAALLSGAIAAVLCGFAGETTATWFSPDGDRTKSPLEGGGPTLESVERATLLNGALTFGARGALLGLVFGTVGGGFSRRGAIGGLAGLFGGGVLGAGLALGAFKVFLRMVDPSSDDLIPPIAAQAAVWGPIGAVAGLAFGLGRGPRGVARAVIGGLVGAILGAALYQVLGAVLFPNDKTSQPLAEAMLPRLLSSTLLATFVAVAIGASLGEDDRERANA